MLLGQKGYLDDELGADAQFAFCFDDALVVGDDFLDVCETESESLDVVDVAGVYAVELLEYLLQVFAFDADAVVLDADAQLSGFVPGADGEFELSVGAFVLHGIVHQVEDDVGEVHLVDEDDGVFGFQAGDDLSSVLLDFEGEGMDDAGDEFVGVDFDHLEVGALVLVHGQLEYLLDLEAQALGLVVDGGGESAEHARRLGDGFVVEHLRGERDGGDGCLELVGHVVDEVVLDLGEFLLAEDEHHGDDEGDDEDEREDDGGHDEGEGAVDVLAKLGEVDLEHAHLLHGVVLEECLREGYLAAFLVVVGALVDALSVIGIDGEVVVHVDAVVGQFGLEVLVELQKVDAVLQWPVAGRVEHGVDDFVNEVFLVEVAFAHDFLQGLGLVGKAGAVTLGVVLVAAHAVAAGVEQWRVGIG